ncbi:MAG: hypothetical protein ACFFFH_02255 [Candidatus Thorarchaeota archaeon]
MICEKSQFRRVFALFICSTVILAIIAPLKANVAKITRTDSDIQLEAEIDEGYLDITQRIAYRYVWINAKGAQILFLAIVGFETPSPVHVFITEHYYSQNNSIEIFMGNQLNYIEFYHDNITKDGIPTGNYINGEHDEISHYLIFNASQSVQISNVQKNESDDGFTYTWGIRYSNIQALIVKSSSNPISEFFDVNVSFIQFNYEYEIDLNQNQTMLKSSFNLGTFKGLDDLFFDNLSLSCLYSSFSHVSNVSSVYINGSTLFTSNNENKSFVMDEITQEVNQENIWINRFKSNYTVIDKNSTEINPIVTVSAPLASIDLNMRSGGHLSVMPLSDYLASLFPPLFTKLKSLAWDESFSLEKSLVRYRICYPQWDGHEIIHDPLLIAQFTPRDELLLIPSNDSFQILIIGIFVMGVISLSIAAIRWKDIIKKQKFKSH